MSKKIRIETAIGALRKTLPEASSEEISEIIKEMEQAAIKEAEEAKEARQPVQKKQFVLLVSDESGQLAAADNLVGWAVQIPEDDNPGVAADRVIRAAGEFNLSKKGRKHPVKTFGEACEAVGSKFLRDQSVAVKTKFAVRIIPIPNQLPRSIEPAGC